MIGPTGGLPPPGLVEEPLEAAGLGEGVDGPAVLGAGAGAQDPFVPSLAGLHPPLVGGDQVEQLLDDRDACGVAPEGGAVLLQRPRRRLERQGGLSGVRRGDPVS